MGDRIEPGADIFNELKTSCSPMSVHSMAQVNFTDAVSGFRVLKTHTLLGRTYVTVQ